MDNLDLLIKKFQEVKEELQKSETSPYDTVEDLEKYISPWWKFGSSKKKAPPAKAEGPARPTGIDKIKIASQEKIQPTSIVSDDRKRAAAMGAPSNPTSAKPPKLTGLDRIKAESQKPITATTIKKDEEEEDLEKGLMADIARRDGPPSPAMMSEPKVKMPTPEQHAKRAAHFEAFQPKVAKKPTGIDRIKAVSSQPLLRSETNDKAFKSAEFGKTINSSYAPSPNDMAMSCNEKLSLNKGGQWDLSKKLSEDDKTVTSATARPPKLTGIDRIQAESMRPISATNSPRKWNPSPGQVVNYKTIDLPKGDPNQKPEPSLAQQPNVAAALGRPGKPLTSIPKLKPAGQAKYHLNTDAPLHARSDTPAAPGQVTPGAPMLHKDENADNCSRCKKKPCVCIKTQGVLVDKMEKGHDEKGRCTNCGDKSCDGADCKTDHAKAAVEANDKKNKGFRNQIKVSGNGQWNLKKSAEAIPSYQFKDVGHRSTEGKKAGWHEYSVHHNGKLIGHAQVTHDGGLGGGIDWDKHPHVESQVMAHHASLKRPINITKN